MDVKTFLFSSLAVPVLLCAFPVAQSEEMTPMQSVSTGQERAPLAAAQALISRVLPAHATLFICELIPDEGGLDVFEVDVRNNRIVLRGNDGVSLAMAFNWYLRYHAMASYDWQAVKPLSLEGPLPLPKGKERHVCKAKERFFLNYCTYGYTFPYTDLSGWQRFLDWMAMNGVNRPLIHGGQEATWLKVWKSYGLTQEQILSFFSAPAHLAWHRMANIDKWGGPLPKGYIEGQASIQKHLLNEARALGMKPILAGFAGHVPEALKSVCPDAKITAIEPWAGFQKYNTWFLDATDPLFNDIQKRFLKEQAEMYGTDHLYAADPFNEITPPSWEPDYIASVAQMIAKGMEDADPKAVWYQMGWTFDFMPRWQQRNKDGKSPLDGMLGALPPGKMVLLEYMGEDRELYRKTNHFNKAPFIWNYLANFGGNTYQCAPMQKIAKSIAEAMKVPNCTGIGSTLEGIAAYPIGFEFTLEAPWHDQAAPDMKTWYDAYARRRAGMDDPAVVKGWNILINDVFNRYPVSYRDRSSVCTRRPIFDQRELAKLPDTALTEVPQVRNRMMIHSMVEALRSMLQASPGSQQNDAYRYDIVNLMRQILAYETDNTQPALMAAYKQQDKAELEKQGDRMLGLIRDLDRLVGSRHEFLLGSWIEKARAWGKTPAEKDYYERNARQILTTWGAPGAGLTDYAKREWQGLLKDYYLPRWEEFIKQLRETIGTEKSVNTKPWNVDHEGKWAERCGNGYPTTPQGDPVQITKELLDKYYPLPS